MGAGLKLCFPIMTLWMKELLKCFVSISSPLPSLVTANWYLTSKTLTLFSLFIIPHFGGF